MKKVTLYYTEKNQFRFITILSNIILANKVYSGTLDLSTQLLSNKSNPI